VECYGGDEKEEQLMSAEEVVKRVVSLKIISNRQK
jgi:hypothetical protein